VTDGSDKRRRSRRRATAHQGPPPPVAQPTPDPAPTEPLAATAPAPRTEKPKQKKAKPSGGRVAGPRGERDLAGPGTSQVGPTGAMRARDLNRPTAADLAEAEAELDIVRRHWAPVAEAAPQPYRAPGRRRK
jgi:hypothetical protein